MPKIRVRLTSLISAPSASYCSIEWLRKNNRGHYVDPDELPTGEAVPVAE